MNQLLLTLGTLTLGGSAAVAALALAGRSTRRRYGARWRCLAWLLLCLRLAVPLGLAFTLAGAAIGLCLTFYLTSGGAYASFTVPHFFIFMAGLVGAPGVLPHLG